GERKTVTALFADIKGSTELMADLDPEEARAIVDPALRLMIDAVHRYGGYIVQSTGDGIFALFGAPIAHEDHPQRALYAALRMQEEIRPYGDNLRAPGAAPVEIRVGVNTGEVVIRSISTSEGHVEYTPIGHTTNLASRMQAIARSGSILTSEHTQRLAEGYFQTKALGPVQIKGMAQPVNVFEVVGLGALRTRLQRSASRGYTKFVGRESELGTCVARWNWRVRATVSWWPRWAIRALANRGFSSSSKQWRKAVASCWKRFRSRMGRHLRTCRSLTCSRTTSRSYRRMTSASAERR